jgi:molybdenum cofactor synthesis domain-containing protein
VISLTDAQAFVSSLVSPLAPVRVPVREARGLVLAEPVVATEPVPPFANTAMDGFAVRSVDAHDGARLRIVGTVAAGAVHDGTLGAGEAVRIMTGAPMPDGADAVIMVELTSVDGDDVVLAGDARAGQHVRPVGDDIRPGDEVLSVGTVLRPAALGVLATVGVAEVLVVPRPRVGVMSTGDELVEGTGPLGPGQIRDSNRLSVLALVEEAGFEAVDLGLIRDDEAAIEVALVDGAATCDAVLSSGGVSMGDFDFVKVVLDRIGDMRWMQVAIRPAKPLAAGTIGSTPIIGLPGNPVSSIVSFELFARPALDAMAGRPTQGRPQLVARLDGDLPRHPDGKIHFVRVTLHQEGGGGWVAGSSGGQGSHHTVAMAAADGLAVLPDGDGVRADELVAVIPLH